MRRLNREKRVNVCVPLLAALVVLLSATAGAAADTPTVRVSQPAIGRVVLDVSDATVSVRKEVTADRSVVTMTTGKDRLSIAVRRGVVTISGPGGSLTVEAEAEPDSDRLLTTLQRSEAARRARALLARLEDGPNTFVGQSLLLTRAILEIGTGSVNALNEHRRWVAEREAQIAQASKNRDRAIVIRASYRDLIQKTPGECWDIYSAEAIRIANDFDDCTADLRWYEAHKWTGCSLLYAVRAEAAMAWFISCNGGVPFKG